MHLRDFRLSFIQLGLTLSLVIAPPQSRSQELSRIKYEDSRLYQNALFIVNATVDELKDVQDINIRINLTEQILSLLAKSRPDRCRQMLDSLFDNALSLKNPKSSGDKAQQLDLMTIVARIIRMTATFDRKLAQSYINKYTDFEKSESKLSSDSSLTPQMTANLQLRLATALIAKDSTLAITLAESTLTSPLSSQTLVFLGMLRKKEIGLANSFFTAALQSIKMRQGNDLNELLLLYSYAFSPKKVPYLTPRGISLLQIPDYINVDHDYPVDPKIAMQYLQTAMQVVLDLSRYSAERSGRLAVGVSGDLYFINLIEPHVATYFPTFAESLTKHKNLIAQYLQPDAVTELQSRLGRFNSYGEKPAVDPILDASTPSFYNKHNDRIYYSSALDFIRAKEYEKALQLAERISPDFREKAKESIMFAIAERAVADSEIEKAESIARRDGNLVRRAYILTLIAEALSSDKKSDRVRASEILTELGQIAAKLDHGKERFAILSGAAAVSSRFDKVRTFEFIREAIKVANKVDDFDGDVRIGFSIEFDGFTFFSPIYRERITFQTGLNRLASEDFDSVLFDVRTLHNRIARLKAIIAVCGPVLSKEIPPKS